jgi:predicted nucleic acid-binding protein
MSRRLGGVEDAVAESVLGAVIELPDTIQILSLRTLSWPMGQLIGSGLRLNHLSLEALAVSIAVDTFIDRAFADRILAFDSDAARHYGTLMAARRRAGQTLNAPDGQIAATASSHGFQLATRNTKDFANCGLVLVNPFDYVSN